MRIIDSDAALAALEKAVEDYGPEWVDLQAALIVANGKTDNPPSSNINCVYSYKGADDQTRRCLVGQAVHDLEFDVEKVAYERGADDQMEPLKAGADEFIAIIMGENKDAFFTAAATSVLTAAQEAQDAGRKWGDALNVARHHHAELKSGMRHVWWNPNIGDTGLYYEAYDVSGIEMYYNDDTEPAIVEDH